MDTFFIKFKDNMLLFLSEHQMKIIVFFAVLIFGYILLKVFNGMAGKMLKHSKVSFTASHFLSGLIKGFLRVIYIIVLLSIAGVPMTSFIAILSAAGLAVALALQGNLSNFASGMMLITFRPFEVGDYIESQGISGTVKEIQVLYTHLLTPDNRKVIIPNSDLTQSRVINFTSEAIRRLDLVISVDYHSDIEKVKALIHEVILKEEGILREPMHLVRLGKQGESSLDFDVKVWVYKENYWDVHYTLQEEIKKTFNENGIEIPFPHRSIIIKQ